MQTLTFTIDARQYAVPLATVSEVVPAVNIQPIIGAPSVVEGAVNVRGEILPVLSLRQQLGHAVRAVRPSEYFIVVRARARRAILRSDTPPEIISLPDMATFGSQPVDRALSGVLALPDGLALFQDIDAFVDAVDLSALAAMLSSAGLSE